VPLARRGADFEQDHRLVRAGAGGHVRLVAGLERDGFAQGEVDVVFTVWLQREFTEDQQRCSRHPK
jgi:hypothetical protein